MKDFERIENMQFKSKKFKQTIWESDDVKDKIKI